MNKIALFIFIVFYALPGPSNEVISQPKSLDKLLNDVKESIEVCVESRTGAKVVYTNPDRGLERPDIQMIAQFVSVDSTNSYRFRV